MCGITACVATRDVADTLVTGLRNLEYRGYDSSGIATVAPDELDIAKREGVVDGLVERLPPNALPGTAGVGHTRWSTHGAPTDANAHPHADCTGDIAVVHNGIIENHAALRRELNAAGHTFESNTDTEVIPHLVEDELAAGKSSMAALRAATKRLNGQYAIAMVVAGENAVYAVRNGSPLVVGIDGDRRFLASDVPSFLEFTSRVAYLEDGDFVRLTGGAHKVWDADGNVVNRPTEDVDWEAGDAERDGYPHFMLKEIHEQPAALERAVHGRITDDGDVSLDALPEGSLAGVSDVHFVACGTSFHAALYARQLLAARGVPAYVFDAGEYTTTPAPVGPDTLVVAVTQSGETADTLASLRDGASRGARTLAVTNVVGSTAAREADDVLPIRAGPEIGVAATKTFSSQVAALTLLTERLAADAPMASSPERDAVLRALDRLPEDVQEVLDASTAVTVSEGFENNSGNFFIGRDTAYPVALEGALKFKEITYEHAEGFAASQLKHGPLALVTEDTPVVAVFSGRHDEKTLSNVQEVRARDAPVVAIGSEESTRVADAVDTFLPIPDTHPDVAGVLANVQLQLVAYHVADRLDRPIDRPRNLAKSVTVE